MDEETTTSDYGNSCSKSWKEGRESGKKEGKYVFLKSASEVWVSA